MKYWIVLLVLSVLLFIPGSVHADPLDNNIYGISVTDTSDSELQKAATLVNSSFGDWGYITLIIQENDRDVSKWNHIFDKCAELHLIPIVRLATKAEGDNWRRPAKEDAGQWASFLDSLDWPVQQRNIVLFNEPNHATEWGGSVNPEDYGTVAKQFAMELTQKNANFFVMIAGLDSAAPSSGNSYEDETHFLNRMFTTFPVSDFNTYISGWASHSYPNPGYKGKPTDSGRNSIKNYQWETQYIQGKGVKSLPVYITETGWPYGGGYYSEETAAQYMKTAFQEVWFKDSNVKAVTPFILNYQAAPFSNFSWEKNSGFSALYTTVKAISKINADPTISGTVGNKALVYRFGSPTLHKHFYTASKAERNTVIFTFPNSMWTFEGPNYSVYTSPTTDAVPVYRFTSKNYGGHFYTASEAEKNQTIANFPEATWKYEGVAFYVYPPDYPDPSSNTTVVHRFTSKKYRGHFYTASQEEKDYVIANFPTDVWLYEGVAWKVPK